MWFNTGKNQVKNYSITEYLKYLAGADCDFYQLMTKVKDTSAVPS